jgi:hypothetical protein
MAYENAQNQERTYIDATFGATSVVHYIVGPKGKVGFVRDIFVDVTTSLVGTSTVPEIDVGISSGDATFGRYRLGSTAILGYGVGPHLASTEPDIVGNPPRTGTAYSGHVVLDGGPLDSNNRVPLGRIPQSGLQVSNVVNGTANVARIFFNGPLPQNLAVGQLVQTIGIGGATASGMTVGTLANGYAAISALSTTANWIELSGTTFGGTYTSGGVVNPMVVVTCAAGTGGSPAGGGQVRVELQWMGPAVD